METEAMEWARIARSFFWPGGVIVLFLLIFHEPITDFIQNLDWIKLSPGGAEAGRHPPDQTQAPKPPGDDPPPEPTGPIQFAASNDTEQLRVLAYAWFYEKMYRLLHGTQTLALDYANKRPGGAPRSEMETYFAEHERRVKVAKLDYDPDWNQWISFMTDSGLLNQQGDLYQITPLGKAFLQWKVAEGVLDSPLL
ncbi:MAG TPA: hypothetical protein VMR52_03385 [Dehalococcoidia bacterium]|nr:hypothetical protein [Dehalococcoidia bacterium]